MSRFVSVLKWTAIVLFLVTGLGSKSNGGCEGDDFDPHDPLRIPDSRDEPGPDRNAPDYVKTAQGAARRCNHPEVKQAADKAQVQANLAARHLRDAKAMDPQVGQLRDAHDRQRTDQNKKALDNAVARRRNLYAASEEAQKKSKELSLEALKLADRLCGPTGHSR